MANYIMRGLAHIGVFTSDPDKCAKCGTCAELCCSTLTWPTRNDEVKEAPKILESICSGCGVCLEVCPNKAISLKEV